MKDHEAWDAMQKLLIKLQYQEIGKQYDTGDRKKLCPICYKSETEAHKPKCELSNAISSIGTMLHT